VLKSLKELYWLLEPAQRRRLLLLQFLVLLMSIAEVVSVLSIGPFMTLVGNLEQLQGSGILAQIYRWSGASSPTQFVFWAGGVSLLSLSIAAAVSMFTLWQLTMYGQLVGAQLSNRLFAHYMAQSWLFHASANSSQLVNNIAQEVQRVTFGIINAFMLMNAKLVMAMVMAMAIFFYNPVVAVIGIILFTAAYGALYKLVKARLTQNGRQIGDYQAARFKLMAESFGGIKDTLLLGRQLGFVERFKHASQGLAVSSGKTQVMSQVPRYAVELIAFGAVIALVMYLVVKHDGDVTSILPVLSIYALAGMKLLPAFQQVYFSVTQIRATLPALSSIKNDLKGSLKGEVRNEFLRGAESITQLTPRKSVELKSISFRYQGAERQALDNLSILIPARNVIGLVGASGSGKSTAIDVLMGLVTPDKGELLVDGVPVEQSNLREWQNTLGYVSQNIYLADSSVRDNIAFGLANEEIDDMRVMNAVKLANLQELVAELPFGLDTLVGERGIQLSGGQRQRIGIARALYHDAQVLVLDEATSALDGITEKHVIEAIQEFGRSKTIIMIAHRLTTVKKCDWIYLLDRGKVVDQGTYDNLLERNHVFRSMADQS
jgi:ATP-binding cassette, subfamily B, bacterial PglK